MTEPTQADREAADQWGNGHYHLIEAFARHRIASTAALSKRVETLEAALLDAANNIDDWDGVDPKTDLLIGSLRHPPALGGNDA